MARLYVRSILLVIVERLFPAVLWGCLRFVIVVFPDHTHLLFLRSTMYQKAIFCSQEMAL